MTFSIITVCYNSEKTIRRTIESVLNQSYQDYEYVVVDGNSTDKTLAIVKEYETQFGDRLKYISEPDSGIYNAMNKGIGLCHGAIIGIVNSDDWLQPDALEIVKKQADELNKSHFIISGWMNFHYTDGSVQVLKNSYERFESIMHRYGMGLRHPATFVSKTAYQLIGTFDEHLAIHADHDFTIRCYQQKNICICLIPHILTNMSDAGTSEQKFIQKHINDVTYILKKYVNRKSKYFYLLYSYKIRIYTKFLLPKFARKIYRKSNA